MDCTDGNWLQYGYNTVDQSTFLRYHFDGVTRTTSYTYTSPDNLPASTSFFGIGKVTNAYDSLTRPSSVTYKTDDDHNDVKAAYGYIDWSTDANRTTSTVRGIDYTFNTGLLSVSDLYYTYDKSGNITAERVWTTDDTKPLREKYTYDQKNQLTRHDSKTQNATFVYTYGKAGNILSVKRYAYTTGTLGEVLETKTYTYGDSSWADLLTQYNGKAITYDGIGNMTSYNGASYTWMGRELRKITNGSNTYSYKYNADGIRTSKTVNGTTTEFFLNGSQILAQKTGDSVMRFFYDSTGKRVGFANGTMLFYYLYNLQGDVIAIVRAATGQVVAKYSYDAWGKCTVTNAAGYAVGDKNPFRYRGYYYDTETGLYYLNSRYYNPEFGRFISADGQLSGGNIAGANLYAYCYCNPINLLDYNGTMAEAALIFTEGMAALTAALGVTIVWAIGIGTLVIGAAELYSYIVQPANDSSVSDKTLSDVRPHIPDRSKVYQVAYVNEKGSLIRIMPYYNYFEALAMLGCLGACNNLRIAKEYDPSSYCKAHKEVNDLGYSTWGIYTHYQIHAKALAVSIGVTTPPEVHGSGKYGHYNDKAHSLHIWFGGILNF